MIKINLLPIERKEREHAAKQNLGFLIVIISIFVILAILIMVLFAANYTLKLQISSVQGSIENTMASMNSTIELKNRVLFIKDRAAEMSKMQNKNIVWSKLLADITRATPDLVTLTNLAFDTKKTPNIQITGLTLSRSDAVIFQSELEKITTIENIIFKSSKEITSDDITSTDFILTADLKNSKSN